MKKNQWMFSILSILFCVIAVLAYPTKTEAASQSDRNAYRTIFDASYYYNSYSDVAAECGMDENALFDHFMNYGIYEGRSCSAAFNPQVYRQRYTDLQEVFGNDMAAYCQHYVLYGRSEGRDASAGGQAATPVSGSAASSRVARTKSDQTAEKKVADEKNDAQEEKSGKKTEDKKTESEDKQADKEVSTKTVKTNNSQVKQSETKKTEAAETKTEKTEATKKTESKIETKAKTTKIAMNIESTEEIMSTELPEASISENEAKMVKSAMIQTMPEEQKSKRQVIGTYTTKYEDNVSRAVNVELAAERINGVEVRPGGKFSFSDTILERTAENGYVDGPIYVKGKEVIGIGGGVCQVSSTLYAAMVDADLSATERHPHSMPVDYVPQNLDATIAGNYLDLKFTNTFSQTLLIEAVAEDGVLTVTLVLE